MKCAIVVAAYNREEPFKRVLNCIKNADYSDYIDIQLIISIDRAQNYNTMQAIAENLPWHYGQKTVIVHSQRLGLKDHFIYCGDLTEKYGPVIFIEDDVFVNNDYYQCASKLTEKYIQNNEIAGAALYSLRYNETARRPFFPLDDGSDVFFCQLMSWAPVYFPDNWKEFKQWLINFEKNPIGEKILPRNVQKWKETSFKKKHIQFMIEKEKYFVYPRISCATNFCEAGEHYVKDSDILQVSVAIGKQQLNNLIDFENSLAVYDAFMEISPAILKKLCPNLIDYKFATDLFGVKDIEIIKEEYIITCKKAKNPILQYGRHMFPHEMNIINNIEGSKFYLVNKVNAKKRYGNIVQYFDDVLFDQKGSSVLKIFITDILWFISAIKARLKLFN